MTVMRTERRQLAWDRTDGRCYYCGCHLLPDDLLAFEGLRPPMQQMHVDHMKSRARGGSDDPGNLFPACGQCNAEKGNRSLEEYRISKGMRLGKFPHRFACEPREAVVDRDFLMVTSKNFRGAIIRASVRE